MFSFKFRGLPAVPAGPANFFYSEQNGLASGGIWTMTGYGAFGYNDISMKMMFNGTGISLVYFSALFGGTADIKIDGKSYPPIDTYSTNLETKTARIVTGLPAGEHTLVISPAKESNPYVKLPEGGTDRPIITIDAIEITRPKVEPFFS